MDNKQKVIGILTDAILAEEKAMPIYTRHLNTVLFWTGLDEQKAARMKVMFEQLARESEQHKQIVEKLLLKIQSEA